MMFLTQIFFIAYIDRVLHLPSVLADPSFSPWPSSERTNGKMTKIMRTFASYDEQGWDGKV